MMDTQPKTNTGWALRGLIAAGVALLSALFVTLFLYEDRQAAAGAEGLLAFVTGTVIGHAIGGAIAGFLLAGAFGRQGVLGWVLALVGGAGASLLSGFLGGVFNTLPAHLSGTTALADAVRMGSAMLVTPLGIAAAPWLGLLWGAGVAALHAIALRTRAP